MASRLIALALAASALVPTAVTAASAPSTITVLEIGGQAIALSDATLPTEGGPARFVASVEVTNDSAAVAWAVAAARGKATSRDGSTVVIEKGAARRRVDWTEGHIVEVKFPVLDASAKKKPLMIDFEWEAETVEFSKASGKTKTTANKPAPLWDASSFRIDGLPGADAILVQASLPRITIAGDKGVTIGDLVLEFEGDDAEALSAQVKKAIKDGKLTAEEYLDLSVTLTDPSMPERTGTVAMPRCKLRSTTAKAPKSPTKNKSGKATVTAVFMVEAFDPAAIVLGTK